MNLTSYPFSIPTFSGNEVIWMWQVYLFSFPIFCVGDEVLGDMNATSLPILLFPFSVVVLGDMNATSLLVFFTYPFSVLVKCWAGDQYVDKFPRFLCWWIAGWVIRMWQVYPFSVLVKCWVVWMWQVYPFPLPPIFCVGELLGVISMLTSLPIFCNPLSVLVKCSVIWMRQWGIPQKDKQNGRTNTKLNLQYVINYH